jgi:hypothetical protein
MSNVNPSALLRSLIVYAICVPLAIVVGYLLTELDYLSISFLGVLLGIMAFPLLMKWHYPLLIFSIGLPATIFFLPGHPNIYLFMVVISLTISTIERILDRTRPSMPSTAVRWPLLAFLLVIFITAKMTGGFGLRSMGSEVYGGKKYVFLVVGILSFFAIAARPIPKKDANLYITLYFAGGFFSFIQDLYTVTPSPLRFIYLVFPPSNTWGQAVSSQDIVVGVTRLGGVAATGGAVLYWMLARHGIRDNFLLAKPWRVVVLAVAFMLMFLGGFRNALIGLAITAGLIFYLEKLHRTGAMVAVVMAAIMGGALLVPLAPLLPYTFQRTLSFLPLNVSADARLDAESSTQWRLDMWEALLPQVPKYLLLGKGYAFSAETFNESMGATAMFQKNIDAAENPLALSSDFHSGPLSVVLSFGIWGVLVWLWYWAAGFFVVWRNYRYGDPVLRHINLYLYAAFVGKCFFFLFIFGGVVEDAGGFGAIIGLSIALNHGVMRRPKFAVQAVPAPRPAPAPGRTPFPARPPFPALGR